LDIRSFNGLMAISLLGFAAVASAASPTTSLVSVGTDGEFPDCGAPENFCFSIGPAVTPDGRYVAFESVAPNIAPGPPLSDPISQVLVHDRQTCTTVRVSESPSGQPGDDPSSDATLSADGQLVAFRSRAGNLVPDSTRGTEQVYVYNAKTQALEMISRSPDGVPGNGNAAVPQISDDGRHVLFQNSASNLVPNDTNDDPDIFVYDRQTETMTRVNVSESGEQANGPSRRPGMSPDGRFVVFDSSASNLVDQPFSSNQVFLLDRDSDENGVFGEPDGRTLTLVSVNDTGEPGNGFSSWGVPSPDGQKVVFSGSASVDNLVPGDTNNDTDVFVRHLDTGTTTRESVGPNGEQTSAGSFFPLDFSADGQFLTFHSAAQELVDGGHNGVTHIFRRNLKTGQNMIISRNSDGELADQSSEVGVMAANGQTVAFTSAATNLEPGFENNLWVNVYVRALQPSDLNGDNVVGVSDLLLLLSEWGAGDCSVADINDDGDVAVADLLELLSSWGM